MTIKIISYLKIQCLELFNNHFVNEIFINFREFKKNIGNNIFFFNKGLWIFSYY